jgi:hypothetical protein
MPRLLFVTCAASNSAVPWDLDYRSWNALAALIIAFPGIVRLSFQRIVLTQWGV